MILVKNVCNTISACEAECLKEIKLPNIAMLNREYLKARFRE